MLSLKNRSLISGLGILTVCISLTAFPEDALAKKKKNKANSDVIASQPWPPAIAPDFIESIKREKLLVANRYGRVSIVDFKNAGKKGTQPNVLAELTGVGKKIVSVSSDRSKTFALLKDMSDREHGPKTKLVEISTKRLKEPYLVSTREVKEIRTPSQAYAKRNLLFLAGVSTSNQNIVLVASTKKQKNSKELKILSTITTRLPIVALKYDGRNLMVLASDEEKSQLSFISLASKTSPSLVKKLDFEGSYSLLSKSKNVVTVAGKNKAGKPEVKTVYMKPAPNIVAGTTLPKLESITSAKIIKQEVLVSGNGSKGGMLFSLNLDKHANLLTASEVDISTKNKRGRSSSKLVYDGKQVYVSAGWAGIETLRKAKGNWNKGYLYSIPRMGASDMASWGNSAILVSGELIKYDLTDPSTPVINEKAPLTSPVRSMVGAGSYILCLTRDNLLLRKMDKINQNIAKIKIEGNSIAFDKEQHRAYVIKPFNKGKLSRVFPVKVYSNSLDIQDGFDLPGKYTKIKASNGLLLVSDLNVISLVKPGKEVETVGHREFENYAIRDVYLEGDKVIATAIDQSKQGFLLVLSANDKNLNVLGNTPLPHNGAALSAKGNIVCAVGKNDKGEDLLTLIDIKSPTSPKTLKSMKVIEAASSIAIKNKVAIVAGRGLEILSVE